MYLDWADLEVWKTMSPWFRQYPYMKGSSIANTIMSSLFMLVVFWFMLQK